MGSGPLTVVHCVGYGLRAQWAVLLQHHIVSTRFLSFLFTGAVRDCLRGACSPISRLINVCE
jgi:hypothetical protein